MDEGNLSMIVTYTVLAKMEHEKKCYKNVIRYVDAAIRELETAKHWAEHEQYLIEENRKKNGCK